MDAFERDQYFLRFGELELFGDPDMLHEIVALQPGR
jgi:hypothetical protein